MTDHIPQDQYVTWREHAQLVERVTRVEQGMETSNKENAARYDKIMDKIDGLRSDMWGYRNNMLTRIIGWGVSFILGGGGVIGILNAFHLLK